MVKITEGCYGVTRVGRIVGPMHPYIPHEGWPSLGWKSPTCARGDGGMIGWSDSGIHGSRGDGNEFIATFPTRAEAEAWNTAGCPPESVRPPLWRRLWDGWWNIWLGYLCLVASVFMQIGCSTNPVEPPCPYVSVENGDTLTIPCMGKGGLGGAE